MSQSLNPIEFKQVPGHDLAVEWMRADPRLRAVVVYASALSLKFFGVVLVVTTLERTRSEQIALYVDGRGSPHEVDPVIGGTRAADLRVRHAPDPHAYGEGMAELVNAAIQSHGRPVALWEPLRLDAETRRVLRWPHLHLQVPASPLPRSERRLLA